MKINLASVQVDDQDKALRFYTEKLGFLKKTEGPIGDAKWITVVSPEEPDGVERSSNRATTRRRSPTWRRWSPTDPDTSFAVADVQAEYERLSALGVTFVQAPTVMGPVTTAIFDDTCGNLVQIAAMN